MSSVAEERAASAGPISAMTVGVLRLGGALVALDLDLLREVVPRPGELSPLPTRARGLLGALSLRDLVIPVVDVRVFAGLPETELDEQVIAIISHGDRILGMLADRIVGLTTLDASRLNRLSTGAGTGMLFSTCIDHPGLGVVSILDAAAMFSLPGVPTVADAVFTERTVRHAGGSVTDDALVLFRITDHRFAIPVGHIHSVLPDVDLRPTMLQGASCLGVTDYQANAVPVADALALTGVGRTAADAVHQGIALRGERGFAALGVTEVIDIVSTGSGHTSGLPPVGLTRPEYFAGLWSGSDGANYLLLDGQRLHDDRDVSAMTGLNVATASDLAPGERSEELDEIGAERAGNVYLRARAAIEFVTPLGQVDEIVELGSSMLPATGDGRLVLGLTPHRSSVMPVIDLGAILGSSSVQVRPDSPVVVVRHGDGFVGFVVAELGAIERSTWEESAAATPLRALGTEGATRVRTEGSRGILPIVDLWAAAAELAPLPSSSPAEDSLPEVHAA